MSQYVVSLILILGVFVVSLAELCSCVAERVVKRNGKVVPATIVIVRKTIPTGFRHLFTGKNGIFPCDYLLVIRYVDIHGTTRNVSTVAHARIRIKNGRMLPFFAQGNKTDILVHSMFPRLVVFSDEAVVSNFGRIYFLFIWGLCLAIAIALLVVFFRTGGA